MFLFIGGSKHGKYLNVERNHKVIFPRMPVMRFYPEPTDLPVSVSLQDTVEVYTLEKLGDPKTMRIKEVFVVEGISPDKAMELLNMILLEWFINDVRFP